MRRLSAAYGAGWRAGVAEPVFIRHADGLKRHEAPRNPYNPRRNPLLWWKWENGYHAGCYQRTVNWYKQRKGIKI